MGKGDKRTKKGKIWRKSYGVSRPRLARNQAVVVLSKEEKEAQLAAAAAKEAKKAEKAQKKAAPKKEKAAPKKEKPAAKKAAPKKAAAKKEAAPKKAAPKKSSGKGDDLKKIEGIGPKIAETLVAAGIDTYAELANTKPEKISEIIAGVRGNHVTDTWPEQSALAAADKWDELKVLQDELDGGKKK